MKILFVRTSSGFSGAEIYNLNLVNATLKNNYKQQVISYFLNKVMSFD